MRSYAAPGFFETLRIPLLYGRVFDARDRAHTPRVAVITDRMGRQYFDAADAVGRRFRLQNDPNSWAEVISGRGSLIPAPCRTKDQGPRTKNRITRDRRYDIAPDGRFLMVIPSAAGAPTPYSVIVNWTAGLDK